jgi:glycosyltransferase involved in cell wall biosynthesis
MTTPLHVAMTVEQCWQRVPGGSASYLIALLGALQERDDVVTTGIRAAHRDAPAADQTPPGEVRAFPLPRYALYRAWNRLAAPRAEWLVRTADVVHASTWAIPPTRRPLVVTVHDLAFLRDESHFTPRGVRFFLRALERTREEAGAVIVPSQATADDCVAAGIERDRIHVVPHGAPRWTVRPEEIAELRTRLDLPERYVLWCGTHEPRKNVEGLLGGFRDLAEQDPTVHLILVGPPGWGEAAPPLHGAWASRVHQLGRLSSTDLRVAYAGALAFCFPSLWEGFGLPVLEAMSVGTPVVTSRGTSMAEVVGDAGILVDPSDVTSIAAGIMRALDDAALLGLAGRTRANGFTWERAAAGHIGAYRAARNG